MERLLEQIRDLPARRAGSEDLVRLFPGGITRVRLKINEYEVEISGPDPKSAGIDAFDEMTASLATTLDEKTCAGIVFAETSVISPGGGGADALATARQFIAGVAYKRAGQGVAKPVIPSDDDLQNPNTQAIWTRCTTAAHNALSDDVGTCKHFVIWYSDDGGSTPSTTPKMSASWPYDNEDKITTSWGPFTSAISPSLLSTPAGSKARPPRSAKAATNMFVFKYCGVA